MKILGWFAGLSWSHMVSFPGQAGLFAGLIFIYIFFFSDNSLLVRLGDQIKPPKTSKAF